MRPFWPRVIAPFLLRSSHGGPRLLLEKNRFPSKLENRTFPYNKYEIFKSISIFMLVGTYLGQHNSLFPFVSRCPPWDSRRRKGAITLGQKGRNLALKVPNYIPFDGLATLWHVLPAFSEPDLTPCSPTFVAKPTKSERRNISRKK